MLNITQRDFVSGIGEQFLFLTPICESVERIFSGGIHVKNLFHLRSFLAININTSRFGIIGVSHRSPTWPYTISDFLSQTSFHILSQIVHKILTLSESNVQHK